MLSLHEYKKLYLSEQPYYQFIKLDDNFTIQESCQSIFELTVGKSLVEFFPFLESIVGAVCIEQYVFLPRIDLSEDERISKFYDFLFFREERYFLKKPIICIIKDVSQSESNVLETEQMARMAMLENEYLNLQYKNIQLENTILQMRNEELRRSRDLKNLFFSKISHELRSPVNGILGLSQIILEQEKPTDELRKYVESIYIASNHLRTILDDILDLSKLENGSITLQKYPFQLNNIFQHLQLNFLKALEKKQLKLYFSIDEQIPDTLLGDEVRLTQIFYNLISNAIKFTEKGSIQVVAKLESIEASRCQIKFTVKDTGIGMTSEELQRIFNPYEQIGRFSFQELGGTGLGLSVVKQLVEIFGGGISVSSEKNIGTIFELSLPFEYVLNKQTATKELTYEFFALKALLVDDSDISRIYTEKLLTKLGFEVESCTEGLVAIEKLQSQYYDLLITDLQMPDLDGDVMVERYEESSPHEQKTAVIFATGSLGIRKLKHTVLLKPFSQEQLIYALKQAIPQEKRTVCNLIYLQKITNGEQGFMQEMLQSLMVSIPEEVVHIGGLLSQKDTYNLYKAVHKLKPSIKLIGSEVLLRIVIEIEKITTTGEPNWEKLQRYYNVMQNLVNSCNESMKKFAIS